MSMVSGKSDLPRRNCIERDSRTVRTPQDDGVVTTLPQHRPVRRVMHGVMDFATAATPIHHTLRNRIAGIVVVSVVVDLIAGMLAWHFEHGRGEITTVWNALFWTTTQMLTVSSQFPNPLTTGGKILDVVLQVYAVTVVTSVAGAFASFFHARSHAAAVADRPPGGPAPNL
jgi:hypothetical protein